MRLVNNFELIKPHLNFGDPTTYYYVQLILRKKDGATTFGNKNNSARLIKTYDFYTLEQFESKQEEIINLCNLFGCRAGINFNRRTDFNVAKTLVSKAVDQFLSENYNMNGILNTVKGAPQPGDKLWLVDCDSVEEAEFAENILTNAYILPMDKPKIICKLPTNSGFHFITSRFNRTVFDEMVRENGMKIEVHMNNPTALYYPDKENVAKLQELLKIIWVKDV